MKTMHKQVVMIVMLLILGSTNEKNLLKGDSKRDFCWKDSFTRGVGKVPQGCAPDQDRIGLLCYPKCPQGMSRFGFDCHSDCPSGWSNQGLFCRNSEYGRGAGYPWKFGDSLNDSGMFDRCGRDNGGRQNCEKNGAIVYPKCRSGYSSFGCCICRPSVPNCSQFNLNTGIDLSCAKKVIIGSPRTGVCGQNEEKDGGLCYPKCKTGYYGVGPVCWGNSPSKWVGCGMGAAVDAKTCASAVFNQVTSVGMLAINIATMGTSGAAAKGATTASKSFKSLPKLAEQVANVKNFYDKNKKVIDKANKGAEIAGKINQMVDITKNIASDIESQDTQVEDVMRNAADIASLVDPTGISDVVVAYTYPKCSKYFPTK
jgi:hypothetical protein